MGHEVKAEAVARRSLVGTMSLISRFTLLSRVLGLARDQLFAALVGAGQGMHADAFVTAFRIPNLLRDLFAEGALSAAFVPVYARSLKGEGRAEAQRLAARMMTLVAVVLVGLVALGFALSTHVVHWLSPGFSAVPGKTDLAVLLTRIMLPFLPLVSLAAVMMGMLNAEERYGPPAIAPALFNLAALAVGASLWIARLPPEQVVLGWAIGTLVGGAAQLAIQVPELRRLGWRFRFDWAPSDPRVRQILWLMAPATIGLAAVQLNIFIGSSLASHEQGAQLWLQNAFRILYLPIGLFGVAIGTLSATGSALRVASGDIDGLRRSMRDALRLLAFLTIPATAGLMVLAEPIVRLLFEHGRYRPADTQATALALVYYSLGLVAYTAVKVLAPAFYSLGSARVPLLGSVTAVATSVALMYANYAWAGWGVVALGTTAGAFVNVAILLAVYERRIGGLRERTLLRGLMTMVAASAVMAVCCWASLRGRERVCGVHGFSAQLATGLAPVLLGIAVYLTLAKWWRIGEADAVLALIERRAVRTGKGE